MDYLVRALIGILEAMFLVGMAGSAMVIVSTLIHDARVMFEERAAPSSATAGVDANDSET